MSAPFSKQIVYKNIVLNFHRIGTGGRVLLAFHGFGQNSKNFAQYLDPLTDFYTIYIFDHFFHGASTWNPEKMETPLTLELWMGIMESFIESENINKFDILAYSIGGKLGLATLQNHKDKIQNIFLIAPDGMRLNVWYLLATSNILVRKIFKKTITRPQILFTTLKWLNKLKLLSPVLNQFVMQQMNTMTRRWQVYFTWMLFRKLAFKAHKTSQLISAYDIKFLLFCGARDHLFPPAYYRKPLRYFPENTLNILNTGHTSLISKSVEIINKTARGHSKPEP